MFRDRADAGRQLAARLQDRPLCHPLVLAIPRGGVAVGAALAQGLRADLDVVLARKLRAPGQPEVAIGALSESGRVYLNSYAESPADDLQDYLAEERRKQLAEIARSRRLVRAVLPAAPVEGRSVILTDDGIATGSTMLAALQVVSAQQPEEILIAVPVASPDRLEEIRRWCDDIVCLAAPRYFFAVGQFYADFGQVNDDAMLELLRPFARDDSHGTDHAPAAV